MTAHRKWTPDEDATLAELLRLGVNIQDIAENLGASYWQVRTRARQLDLEKTPRARTPAITRDRATLRGRWTEAEDEILRRYGTGLAPLEMVVQAKLPGRSRNSAAHRILVLQLGTVRPLSPTPKNLDAARAQVRKGVTDILELACLTGLQTRDLKDLLR